MYKNGDKLKYAPHRNYEAILHGHNFNVVYTVSRVAVTTIGTLVWFHESCTATFAENLINATKE